MSPRSGAISPRSRPSIPTLKIGANASNPNLNANPNASSSDAVGGKTEYMGSISAASNAASEDQNDASSKKHHRMSRSVDNRPASTFLCLVSVFNDLEF